MKEYSFKAVIPLGVIIMTTTDIRAGSYQLKQPQEYFRDEKSITLLGAALSGDLVKARQIVAEGANPNDEGPPNAPYDRLRLLHYAIAADNPTAVKILVAVGADPELDAEGNGRAFAFVMKLDKVEMLSLLLELRPLNTLSKDTVKTLLFRSITVGRPRCLELFLRHGAPVDLRDDAGYTTLMRAMDAQDYDLAEWLLKEGASVNIEAVNGVTPAYSAQFHLNKFRPGSATYNKVLHIKKMMEKKGAVFPALTPREVRAKRGKR